MERAQQFAYAAGILDGEGCFGVNYDKANNSYAPRVQVVMTDAKPLQVLQGLFGGSLNVTKMDAKGNKVPYHYTASGKNARRLIECTMPYLIEKKSQAEVLVGLQRNIDEWNAKPRQRGNLPAEVTEYRRSLYERARDLKMARREAIAKQSPMSAKEKMAYLAGVLEAEGCFSIIRGEGASFASVITVQMQCTAVLGELRAAFGGTIIERDNRHGKISMWRVKGQPAADVCREIKPYMAFRHEEAELLRNLQNTTNLWAKRVGRKGMPEHITAQRIAWMNRIHEIHRGARAETKSEHPRNGGCDSPICNAPIVAGPISVAAA